MNKQYIFLTMIGIMLYILYLIITFSIEEYKVSSNIKQLQNFIIETTKYNKDALETIEYKQSKAYKNMILKEQQSLKNKWEKVIYLTTQQNYNKYTTEVDLVEDIDTHVMPKKYNITDNMNIPEKWMYYIFKKSQY